MKSFVEILTEQKINIENWKEALPSYLGYAAVVFRNSTNLSRDVNSGGNYILNSKGDTWFRSVEGNSKGYGLAIQDLKLTSKNPVSFGSYQVYKATMNWIDNEENPATDNIWLLVHEKATLEEVLAYIKTHKNKWKP